MRFDESKWKVVIFYLFDYVIIFKEKILNLQRINTFFKFSYLFKNYK
jgi:hypothetical protein